MERFSFRNQLPYRIDGVDFIEMHYRDRSMTFSRGRSHNALIYTASGCMTYGFEDGTVAIPAGEAIFIPKGTRHSSSYAKEGAHAVLINFDVVEGALPEGFDVPKPLGKCGMERELDELRRCIPHSPIRMFCVVYSLLERLVRENEEIPALYRKILPAIREIERNYAEECRVSDLASLCCMSESGLRRLFREYVGASPVDYRNTVRLHRAKQLIASGEYSIAEAAAQVGFANLSFFYRLYKRCFGCPPGEGTRD